MIKRALGIDWFDLLVHVGITGMVMIIVASAARGPDVEAPMAGVVAVSLGLLAWRRKRAQQSRPGETTGEVQAERLALMEERIADLEQGQQRVMELEERLDFTERLLVRQQEAARLGPGSQES